MYLSSTLQNSVQRTRNAETVLITKRLDYSSRCVKPTLFYMTMGPGSQTIFSKQQFT